MLGKEYQNIELDFRSAISCRLAPGRGPRWRRNVLCAFPRYRAALGSYAPCGRSLQGSVCTSSPSATSDTSPSGSDKSRAALVRRSAFTGPEGLAFRSMTACRLAPGRARAERRHARQRRGHVHRRPPDRRALVQADPARARLVRNLFAQRCRGFFPPWRPGMRTIPPCTAL